MCSMSWLIMVNLHSSGEQRTAVQTRWETEVHEQKLPEGWTCKQYKHGSEMCLGWRSPEGKLIKSLSEFQSLTGPIESSGSEYFSSPENDEMLLNINVVVRTNVN